MERKQARFHYTAERQLFQLEGDVIPVGIGKQGFCVGYYVTLFYDVDMDDFEHDEVMGRCYDLADSECR